MPSGCQHMNATIYYARGKKYRLCVQCLRQCTFKYVTREIGVNNGSTAGFWKVTTYWQLHREVERQRRIARHDANDQAIADRETERRRANAAVARGQNLVRAWRSNTPTMDVAIAQFEHDEAAAIQNISGDRHA